ncbi:Fur family transcriptional regulator [Deinococcus cellulosilyticus]|uniref:Transcriptional repressor n=1 Tax=Deinococcus cellulosilyticus (strain DSM 18568 / NBRC 106333 / KACC 11606 / 5516J-15) TaxID=1223518 RepID=A0A511N4I4_DEIC1|nr:Fur family transcriptional regulator [Deinococcus cellulosilyticus]GEM47291.1 transcriptional repressor [Deinococcus cellulosilyticus NBRC 106333 = KACC 11606]
MEDPSQIARTLQACGLRPSAPRRTILTYLHSCEDHPTPYEMLDGLKRTGHPISIATLYQNLQVLSEAGLIRKFVDAEGTARYDANTSAHHHLHCTVCGRILDLVLSEGLQATLSQLGKEQGWQVAGVQLELEGTCPQCQGNA